MNSTGYVSREHLDQLAESMRIARQRAGFTLVEMGTDPAAPRSWSHSHLSRCERGFEVPSPDLVAWYEVKAGLQKGFLEGLRRMATGSEAPGISEQLDDIDADFILDRIEFHVDFTGEKPLAFHTRDLVVRAESGVTSYPLLVDTYDPTRGVDDYPVEVRYGGTMPAAPRLKAGTLSVFDIELERSLQKGDFHRLQVVHTLPDTDSVARWVTIATRREEVREVVISVQFPRGEPHQLWRVERVYLEVLNAAFGPLTDGDPDELLGPGRRVELGPSGFTVIRFNNPRPGMHYGLGWK